MRSVDVTVDNLMTAESFCHTANALIISECLPAEEVGVTQPVSWTGKGGGLSCERQYVVRMFVTPGRAFLREAWR